MKKVVIGRCPICEGDTDITEISCNSCKSVLKGRFKHCKFCELSKDNIEFAEIFIRNRGSIKDIERELGISYPTVKNKLDNLIEALGYKVAPSSPEPNKMEVLEKLNKGELTYEEALKLL